jgi:WD40 repeat protein
VDNPAAVVTGADKKITGRRIAVVAVLVLLIAAASVFATFQLTGLFGRTAPLGALDEPHPSGGYTGPNELAFRPGSSTLADLGVLGHSYLWDTASRELIGTLPVVSSFPSTAEAAFSPTGGTLAVLCGDSDVCLLDTATRDVTARLVPPPSASPDSADPADSVSAVAFGPHGTTVAGGDTNHDVFLWDTATRRLVATFTAPGYPTGDDRNEMTTMAFSPDGRVLAAGDANGVVSLWDVPSGRRVATLTEPTDGYGGAGPGDVVFSPDGKRLVTVDPKGDAYVWDTANWRRITALTPPEGPGGASAAAFSPDGKTLVLVTGNAYLWDTATWHVTRLITPYGDAGIARAAISPDGTVLALGDYSGNITLWGM